MTSNPPDDATVENFAELPVLASDPARADRTRRRCRALLVRQEQRRNQHAWRSNVARRGVARVIVGTVWVFFIVYLTALVATAMRLQSLFDARPMP